MPSAPSAGASLLSQVVVGDQPFDLQGMLAAAAPATVEPEGAPLAGLSKALLLNLVGDAVVSGMGDGDWNSFAPRATATLVTALLGLGSNSAVLKAAAGLAGILTLLQGEAVLTAFHELDRVSPWYLAVPALIPALNGLLLALRTVARGVRS